MVTTSGNLVAGTAINGQGGDGNGRFNLKAKLALGLAVLGCAGALAFGGLRVTSEAQSQAVTGPTAASSTYASWTGTCRAGGSDCLPDEVFLSGVIASEVNTTGGLSEFLANEGPSASAPRAADTGLREYLDGEVGAVSANAPGGYRLSAPNEADPDGSIVVAAPALQPVEASTSAQFRWAFGPESGATTSATARQLPNLWSIPA